MATEQEPVASGAGMEIVGDDANVRMEKNTQFIRVYRDADFFMDITPMKIAVTLVTGEVENTLMTNYAETVADLPHSAWVAAFVAKVSGNIDEALGIPVNPSWAKTAFSMGADPADIVRLMKNLRVMQPDPTRRYTYEDADSLTSFYGGWAKDEKERTGEEVFVHLKHKRFEEDGTLQLCNLAGEPFTANDIAELHFCLEADFQTPRQKAAALGISLAQYKKRAYEAHKARKAAARERYETARAAKSAETRATEIAQATAALAGRKSA